MKAPRFLLLALLLLLSVGVVAAATTSGTKRRARPARTNPEDASQRVDINNVSMVVKNTGSFAYDTETGGAGLEFPKGTGKTAVFAAGLWIGALVNGGVRVSVAEYSDDFKPGAAPGGVPENPDDPALKVYKLNRVYLNPDGSIDAATRDAALADYNAGAVPRGAPPVIVNPDGTLSIAGDQMLWSVFNDCAKGAEHNNAASLLPLNIEIQLTTFAFARQGPLGNTVFSRYHIINRGTETWDNAYVSQWSDPDLGGASDDLVGCDTTLSVGFVYNATNNDEQYGSRAPSVGFDFLQGPKVVVAPGDTVTLGLGSFNLYPNGGGPQDSTETYNYMQGLLGNGSPVIATCEPGNPSPGCGQPTTFNASGDPVANKGFLDQGPSDRRLMLSSGPFTMAPGETQDVVVGIVVAQGTGPRASIALMKCFDEAVQFAYDVDFNLPSPPNNPVPQITPRDGSVFIKWDAGSETYSDTAYVWEGYNVYQGASVAGPFTRIATYDRVDGIQTVLDIECDPESPVPLPKVKAFGTDSGIQYSIELSEDRVRGGPLNSASAYYYTVTAYSIGLGKFQQVLESSFSPIQVVPQTPPAGVDLAAANVSDITHTLDPGGPPGQLPASNIITVDPVDPAAMINANWEVGFKPNGADVTWYLVRKVGTAVDTVVNNNTNMTGDANYQIFNGIRVTNFQLQAPAGLLGNVVYADTAGGHPTPLIAVDRALPFFGGGGGYAADDFLAGTIPSGVPAPNVVVRFTGGLPGQKAYHYVRQNGALFQFTDYIDVPFTVFDIDANQQKNVAFTEMVEFQNGQWDPFTDARPLGGREILFVLNSNYSGNTPDPFYLAPANANMLDHTLDQLYEFYSQRPEVGTVIDAGDKIQFVASIPPTPQDHYTFSTTAKTDFVADLAKNELGKIRAVPNPYFAHSTYELNRFNRALKFTHLPARCTIRLFDLAGTLVRTIEKNDNTSQATWDLNTDRGLPIGSGVYIFHIDAPGVGSTTGKVAVFMEKERLNNF